jgi:hypothetical protein
LTSGAGKVAENPWTLTLGVVLAAALLLRLWGVDYGLPLSYWQDEYHELMRAMELGAGSFNFTRVTKGGFYLLLFFEYGLYYVVLRLSGAVGSTKDFAELFVRDPTMFYLIGRTTAVAIGCLTVAAGYWIARFAYSTRAALVAAVFLAINVVHVDLSHRIGVDIPMVACAALAIYYGMKLAADATRRNYVLAALFAGLATTTKLPGILVLVPLVIAHAYAIRDRRAGLRGWISDRMLWTAFGIFVAVFVATNPGVLFHAGLVEGPAGQADVGESDEFASAVPGARPNLYLYYLGVMLDSMGWPIFVLALAATGWAAYRRSRADMMLLSYALANYLAISSTSSQWLYYPRYALPIIFVMLVLAARLFADIAEKLRWRRLAAGSVIAFLIAWPTWRVAADDYSLTLTDTRTVARDWFEANVPAGTTVLVEGGKIGPKRETVQLVQSRTSLERSIAFWRKAEPRQAKYLEVKLAVAGGGGYDLVLVQQQSVKPLDDYAKAGVEYFILRPVYFSESRKAGPGAEKLLRDLRSDPRVTLVRRFAPESRYQRGDTVEIYRLTH